MTENNTANCFTNDFRSAQPQHVSAACASPTEENLAFAPALSTADCARILNAVTPDSFEVAYFFGAMRTAKMYAGDRTADLKAAREGRAVWEVAVNLIEY